MGEFKAKPHSKSIRSYSWLEVELMRLEQLKRHLYIIQVTIKNRMISPFWVHYQDNFWSIEPHHDQNCTFLDFLLSPAQATVPIYGQKCHKDHLRTKIFPTSSNMSRLVAGTQIFLQTTEKSPSEKYSYLD
jgi:hypothetical protein